MRARGEKKKGREARSDRAVGHLSSSWWRFSCSVFPAASVAGFGNVGGKFGAIRLWGVWKIALKVSVFCFGRAYFAVWRFVQHACVSDYVMRVLGGRMSDLRETFLRRADLGS